ncbi:winged helix-turn-helix transcriptional regulator [Sphingomonas astaxanthinifaciens]|nr:helix-turn-helix domain-containing protein [Sphingomonas astaxanthinifaciens]
MSAKWSLPVLRVLLDGPTRFSVIRNKIDGITANLLAARLKELEKRGVLVKDYLPEPANRAVYRLTEKGKAVREIVEALDRWSEQWANDPHPHDAEGGSAR